MILHPLQRGVKPDLCRMSPLRPGPLSKPERLATPDFERIAQPWPEPFAPPHAKPSASPRWSGAAAGAR